MCVWKWKSPRTMRGFGVGLGLVAGIATAAGLGYAINRVSKKADEHLNAMRVMLDNRSRDLIRAVPGERYLQLIDDLYGENKDARERAQTFLTKLAGINPQSSLEASARFGFNEQPPLHAQLFGASVASVEVVKLALDKHEIPNPLLLDPRWRPCRVSRTLERH